MLLSSEHGTYKTVKAIFWPWLSGKSPETLFKLFSLRSEAVLGSKVTPRRHTVGFEVFISLDFQGNVTTS